MVRRTITEWSKLIEDYYTSGLSQTEWCEKENINLYTFRDRLSKMRKDTKIEIKSSQGKDSSNNNQINKESEKEVVEWIEYEAKAKIVTKEAEEIEIRIGKASVLIKPNFNEEAFCKVCNTLVRL